jgi:hypothetical protein
MAAQIGTTWVVEFFEEDPETNSPILIKLEEGTFSYMDEVQTTNTITVKRGERSGTTNAITSDSWIVSYAFVDGQELFDQDSTINTILSQSVGEVGARYPGEITE